MCLRVIIDSNDPQSIQRARTTEWLLTNSLGGYAMGTVLGVNTRRYHGLLIAATNPPLGRIVALHSIVEQLVIHCDDGTQEIIDLSVQQFVSHDSQVMLHPDGWQRLRSFQITRDGVQWRWEHDGIAVTKRVAVEAGENRIGVQYALENLDRPCELHVRPLVSFRDFHSLHHDRAVHELSSQRHACSVGCDRYELAIESTMPASSDAHVQGVWKSDPQWWNQFAYSMDSERGQDWIENVWSPGYFVAAFDPKPQQPQQPQQLNIHAALQRPKREDRQVLISQTDYRAPGDQAVTPLSRLKRAANDFVVTRLIGQERFTTIIAGYPWFSDWGRDTMISLSGLLLCTGQIDKAPSTLLTFARHLRNGLIPNNFDEYGSGGNYNTVDASLWFVHAAHEYCRYAGGNDNDAPPELLHACRTIIAAYRNGTEYNIRMDADGLIAAGDETTQLTWMDARRDGVVFTPRHGKAVEINALWHNALRCLAAMTDDDREREELSALAQRAADSFRTQFWWRERECLHDCLMPQTLPSGEVCYVADGKLRPNQIFAVSLPFSPLDAQQQRAVVKIVEQRLLTPFGLRTLDRDDPAYCPRFEGDLFNRDRAYHNGTVWPWLIGPYCEALLRVNQYSEQTKQRVRALLQPLLDEMDNLDGGRCLGQIAEVYDADEPHCPAGCVAQAWSVAELLRILTMIDSAA